MDGIGLSLENYDGAGQFRVMDAGFEIDASGDLDGVEYADQAEFAQVLRDNPAIPECLVERLFAYSLARPAGREDKPWLKFLNDRFSDQDYQLKPLMRSLASSKNFFAVTAPAEGDKAETQMGSR